MDKNPYLRQQLRIAPQQKLTLTPALLQKIELLQLSKLELTEFIKNELLQNPFLEEGPELVELSPPAPGEVVAATGPESPEQQQEPVEYGPLFEEYLSAGRSPTDYEDYDKPGFETFAVRPSSLYDHLMWQINLVEQPPEVTRMAQEIIGNLTPEGYLEITLEELCQSKGGNVEEAREALRVVQQLDPPGVGARNLQECLLSQLRYWEEEDTLAYRILDEYAGLLESGQMEDIAGQAEVTMEELQAAVERIRHLNPKPGLQYQPDATIYIQPDVYIYKVGKDYQISINDDGMPRLHINPFYRRMMESGETRGEERRYIREKFKNAMELIRNLDHRKRTVYRVCTIIIERQRAFLEHGLSHLQPMLLKDVAEELGLHTSTISRAVTNKWAHCPQGIMELRNFFTLGFKTDSGEDISVHILKDKIKSLIDQEDPGNPLSDSDITTRLNRSGIDIKRRTVAKYREEMEIPNSRYRKKSE